MSVVRWFNELVNRQKAILVDGFNHLENISQWEGLSHILWKTKNVPNHQLVLY